MSSNRPQKAYEFFQGSTDKPKFEDFGTTAKEYEKFAKGHNPWNTPLQIIAFLGALIAVLAIGTTTDDIVDLLTYGFVIWIGLSIFVVFTGELLKRHSPQYRKAKSYNEALDNYYMTKKRYWIALKGTGLEYRVGDLYRKLGYKVEHTSRTDDKGIDLIPKKEDTTTIVQCKGHSNPVGPAVVRELLGTLISYGAKNAILIAPVGFTKGAQRTAAGRMIQLVSSDDLIEMADALK